MEHCCNGTEWGKPKYSEKKTCPVATLYTTNPTWIGLGLNLNLCGNRSTTYCLSHCIACTTFKFYYFCLILKCTHIMLFCFLLIYFPGADLQILSTYLFLILLQFFLLCFIWDDDFCSLCTKYHI